MPSPLKRSLQDMSAAALVGCASVVMAVGLIGRPLTTWNLPFMYRYDAMNVLMIVQTGIERGWPTGSDRLGAPGTLDLANYPMCEAGQLLLMQLLSFVGGDASTTLNLYFLATFVLAAATAFCVLRRLGIAGHLAALGAWVFSLLPCHFWRGTKHMFVNGYFWVPLLCYVILRLPALASTRQRRAVVAVAFIAPLINVYYTFFFAFLLVCWAALDAYERRTWKPAPQAHQALVALGAGMVVGLLRSLPLYMGRGLGFHRDPVDSEIFGLKMVQMLLPAFKTLSSHVREAHHQYMISAPLQTENSMNDLGVLGGCALLLTFTLTLAWMQRDDVLAEDERLVVRAGLNVFLCILFGTIGGISAIFAYAVSAFIRSVNRIEVFIAFFACVAALAFAQRHVGAFIATPRGRVWATLGCSLGVLLLFWDINQRPLRPPFAKDDPAYVSDAAYFGDLEAHLPAGARIYQLPHVYYPEGGEAQVEYRPFRAYLHTRQLVWSFGAVRGSEAEQSNAQAEALLLHGDYEGFRAALKHQGFTGVLLSQDIAGETHSSHRQLLAQALGRPQSVSPNGAFAYFPLPL